MWEVGRGGLTFIIQRYIIFSKLYQRRKSNELDIKPLETLAEKTRLKMKVLVMGTSISEENIS